MPNQPAPETPFMNAVVPNQPGPPEALEYWQVPRPVPAADQVLLRVRAFGLAPSCLPGRGTRRACSFRAS